MKTYVIEYIQELHEEKLHFVDVVDRNNDDLNDKEAWSLLRSKYGVFRDNAYIQDRNDIGDRLIEYRFIELIPSMVEGTIELKGNNRAEAIDTAEAILGSGVVFESVEEAS